jgi:hypothetical protein
LKTKQEIMAKVDCDDGGEVREFVGCKIDIDAGKHLMRITQPVLVQSFQDEFTLAGDETPKTPGVLHNLERNHQSKVNDEPTTGQESGN